MTELKSYSAWDAEVRWFHWINGIGCAFAVNLLWRLIRGFIGGPHVRWRSLLPGGRGDVSFASRAAWMMPFFSRLPLKPWKHRPSRNEAWAQLRPADQLPTQALSAVRRFRPNREFFVSITRKVTFSMHVFGILEHSRCEVTR